MYITSVEHVTVDGFALPLTIIMQRSQLGHGNHLDPSMGRMRCPKFLYPIIARRLCVILQPATYPSASTPPLQAENLR